MSRRPSLDSAARPAILLAAAAAVLSAAFACTPGDGKTAAAAAGIACRLVTVFDQSSTGALVGAFCEDVAKLVSDALAAEPMALKATPQAPCGSLVEIRFEGRLVGVACPAYASLATRAAQGAP